MQDDQAGKETVGDLLRHFDFGHAIAQALQQAGQDANQHQAGIHVGLGLHTPHQFTHGFDMAVEVRALVAFLDVVAGEQLGPVAAQELPH